MSNTTLQGRVADHHRKQFGRVSVHRMLSKLSEEVGELHGAIIRQDEIRDDRDWTNEIRAELMDVLTVLSVIASHYSINMVDARVEALEYFLTREWTNLERIND